MVKRDNKRLIIIKIQVESSFSKRHTMVSITFILIKGFPIDYSY